MTDILKTVVQDLINDRNEQAQVAIHQYLVQKMQEMTRMNEAKTTPVSVHDAVLKAIEASMVRHARLSDVEVTQDEVFWTSVYDFPEHRNGLSKLVRDALKGVGKVTIEKYGSQRDLEFALVFSIVFSNQIEANAAKQLEVAIKDKFKDAM